ncbi:MAG: hypothetical protein ABI920_06580, partial [Casimicrobiaceae bacterium]
MLFQHMGARCRWQRQHVVGEKRGPGVADGWFADLPFGLPHRRASAKQWLAPGAVFLQEPLHFLLDTLRERAASILAGEPAERMQALGGMLADVSRASDVRLDAALEAHAIDTATRVIFAIRAQLDDAAVPGAWKDRLRPWLDSPALAVDARLPDRLASRELVRELATRLSAALAVWPTLWAYQRRQCE